MPAGQPLKFKTVADLQEKINSYFKWCDDNPIYTYEVGKRSETIIQVPVKRPYTIEGLAEHLKTTRQTLLNYQKEVGYEKYFDTITCAKEKITRQKVEGMVCGVFNASATKFDLTNNSSYVDKKEVAQTTDDVDLSNLSPDDKLEWKRLKKKMRGE